MNRFAFPYEWMVKNWPRSSVSEAALCTPPESVIEINLAGAVLHVAPGAIGARLAEMAGAVQGRASVPHAATAESSYRVQSPAA
jgi:hypothetical protein